MAGRSPLLRSQAAPAHKRSQWSVKKQLARLLLVGAVAAYVASVGVRRPVQVGAGHAAAAGAGAGGLFHDSFFSDGASGAGTRPTRTRRHSQRAPRSPRQFHSMPTFAPSDDVRADGKGKGKGKRRALPTACERRLTYWRKWTTRLFASAGCVPRPILFLFHASGGDGGRSAAGASGAGFHADGIDDAARVGDGDATDTDLDQVRGVGNDGAGIDRGGGGSFTGDLDVVVEAGGEGDAGAYDEAAAAGGAGVGGGPRGTHDGGQRGTPGGLSLDGVGVAANFTRHAGSGPKEKLGHGVDAAKVAAILKQLYLPKTETWADAKVNRLIVNKNAPENKYHPARKMDPETLPHSDLTVTFDTCAVVGNGGVLVHDEYGEAIDAHDAVFRFNDGPTATFEKLVGSKTTFRIINNNWSRAWMRKRARGASEEHLLLFGMGAAKSYEALVKRYPDVKVWFMAPEFAGVARGMYKKAYLLMNEAGIVEVKGRNSPPTGVEGLFFALAVCKQVHLYGFGIAADPTVPYHYHDKVKGVEAAHSFGFQAIFLKMLAQSGHFDICVPGLATPSCLMRTGKRR